MSGTTVGARRYRPAVGLAWSVETAGLRLADGNGAVFDLGYPEAAVWELLARGLDMAKVVDLARWIAGDAPAAAPARVEACIDRWCRAGWIVEIAATGRLRGEASPVDS